MRTEHWCSDTDRAILQYLGGREKILVPVPPSPPKIPHGLAWD